ncbi:GNAT family N-acetyltransferase [Clostridium tagluense]|uniref:GNAT family N-acetyltransferase n=1 Tax=Clostridium tagluense TaxID=360422 RepID=UPI001CF2BCC6|nr:GNAT family N-acetyltransferase [Clostridium tagluense]MCB2314012.1 GNAT family N-acetyltransferase [Clostridium tagluense]MCB2318849.1 GNAT family N-acetyltransferase [Clostridium tagluense]MCB2323700.1 GNAT family N-acetyltransferase [Clostridium tagluense]MCB2328570.1 GNAT family N-acetyltransferase [Clostridium tagluense]MCB2333426.1 GNAT family N-acetyltransferase [Clostridium tagluense]
MIEVTTQRLKIIPLDIENYRLYIENSNEMEENLGLKITNKIWDKNIKGAFQYRFKKVSENKERYLWETLWIVICKEENCEIASLMIKGYPNEKGEVIIGYGTNETFQNKGYMTEAVEGLIKWIFTNPKALSIVADTEKTNIASHRVLEKNGFIKYKESVKTSDEGEVEELVWWRLVK